MNRDLKVILFKFFDGTMKLFGRIMYNDIARLLSWIVMIWTLKVIGIPNIIANLLVISWIGWFYMRIKEKIQEKEDED